VRGLERSAESFEGCMRAVGCCEEIYYSANEVVSSWTIPCEWSESTTRHHRTMEGIGDQNYAEKFRCLQYQTDDQSASSQMAKSSKQGLIQSQDSQETTDLKHRGKLYRCRGNDDARIGSPPCLGSSCRSRAV
jgi:hypothetical protein